MTSAAHFIEENIRIINNALQTSSGSARCERALSRLYELLGDQDKAFGAYCHAMILEPDNPWATGHYSHLLIEIGRFGEAEQVLRSAIASWPQVPSLWNRLGVMLARQGRIQEAAGTMLQGLSVHPEDEPIQRFHRELQARLPRLSEVS